MATDEMDVRGASKRSHEESEPQAVPPGGVQAETQTAEAPKAGESNTEGSNAEDIKAEQRRGDKPQADAPPPKRQATDAAKKEAGNGAGVEQDSGAEEANAQAPLEKKAEVPDSVIEEGRIFFLFRPKVSVENPQSIDDVQRFFFILGPTSREGPLRLLAVGKKRLPKPSSHERFFGFVMSVDKSVDALVDGLSSDSYETKTRGTRTTPAARVIAEGVYSINSDGGSSGAGSTHLSYKLELPKETGPVQEQLGLAPAATMVLSMKNPDMPNPGPNAGLDDKADFLHDEKKMEQFGNYRWIGCRDPELLDYPRCEFLLIGAGEQTDATEHLQQLLESDVVKALHAAEKGSGGATGGEEEEEAALLAKLREELHPQQADLPTKPAKDGQWT